MRMSSNIHSLVSSYHLWLLGLGASLILLGSFSHLSNLGSYGYSGEIEEQSTPKNLPSKNLGSPPILAYSISGSDGDGQRIMRLLKAIYHPRNQYLLLLDEAASDYERARLAASVHSERTFQEFGNVNVAGKSYGINKRGISAVTAMLHGAALLLKLNEYWDWFTALSVFDYPLLTQDDVLYAFTRVPRNLNFVQFANNSRGNEEWQKNANQIVVDTNLFLSNNGPVFSVVGKRETPKAFKLYNGSPWMMLSREFIEHCVIGWDNLPRKLLMYLTNTVDPLESYFHTILCNSPEFQNTTVNNDLSYNIKDPGAGTDQISRLDMESLEKVPSRGGIFARSLRAGDSTLDEIDKAILNRQGDMFVPGKWCMGTGLNESSKTRENLYSTGNDIDSVKPGPNGVQFKKFLSEVRDESLQHNM
ncbi:hypothetical protein Leryth_024651 [Lithospermum erythrorhizon]|nr:hypothetical protein Leryth_024651 [Lithospermum erythrorhizon]